MHTLTLIEDIFAPSTWQKISTDDVLASLQQKYARFPETARLYCGQISKSHDVTPKNEKEIEAIAEMQGDFFMVEYPADPVTLTYIAYAIIAVVAIVAITNRPKLPNSINRNQQATSPNNALQGRTNQPRVNGRIPDIFGTVHSTPDLIAVPYTIFKAHIEFEYSYMCIGRGEYAISADTVRDGQTIVSKIQGTTVEIFAPFNSPNDGASPQLRIGTAIDRKVIATVRSKSVNGQTLIGPNESSTTKVYNNLVAFTFPNKITAISGNPVTFLGDYVPGDEIVVTTSDVAVNLGVNGCLGMGFKLVRLHADGRIEFNASNPLSDAGSLYQLGSYIHLVNALINNGGGNIDFSGKYLVTSVSGDELTLQTPGDSNVNWTTIAADFAGGPTPYTSLYFNDTFDININFSGVYEVTAVADKELTLQTPQNKRENNSWVWMPGLYINGGDSSYGSDGSTVTIGTTSGDEGNWVGPFVLDVATMNQVIANYVAVNGMYKDNGSEQTATNVEIQLGVTLCNAAGVALASEQFFTVVVEGSAAVQASRAATLFANLSAPGIYMVRSRRLTPKDLLFSGQIVDEVKWRDVYASSPVGDIDFGNVTTVHAVTQATQTALAISERQLNMVVTRKLPVYHGGSLFGPTLAATNSADDIISFICRDPKIGNRPDYEVDYEQIYETIAAVKDYFGVDVAGEFCYTFDTDNISFEEMIVTIAQAVFCTANRRGRVIELKFERETEDSELLFNHRNKIPKTEKRTSNFGRAGNWDGVTFDYVSPVDGAAISFYIPADRSAVNPKPVNSVGIRSETHAHLHAYREWNRIRYQNRAVEFDATQEAELISLNSRILISDNTRPDTQDGDILSQSGLVLELSQPAVLLVDSDYVIMLQMPTGFVEIIPILPGVDPYHVILSSPPTDALSVSDEIRVRTVYEIVKAEDAEAGNNKAFLLTEKNPQSNFVIGLVAVNYDARYYQNDLDFA